MADVQDFNAPTASVLPFLRKLLATPPMGPPAPQPEDSPDFQPPPQLNTPGMDAPAQPQQPPPNPIGDLAATPPADMGKPQLAGETKGHKLLRILMGTAMGGLNGMAANAQTYAATGRNAGFGGGFSGAQTIPLQRAGQMQELQRGELQNQQLAQSLPFLRATQFANLGKTQAETQKLQGEAQGLPIKQALEQAQTEAANYKEDPNMGLIDLRTKQPVNPAGLAPLSAEEAQVLGKQPGDRVPLKLKNTANEIVQRGLGTVAGANDTYVVNKGTGAKQPLGIGSPRAIFAPENRIIQTADPNKPGETTFMRAGDAVKNNAAGPQSASVQVPKAVEKKATSGNWADQKIAFNTAIQHAELLRDAARALNNSDSVAFNAVKNELARQFGDEDITNFDAIANAYNHEVTSVISKGHMTDSEVGKGNRTLPLNANYKTIDKVLSSYQNLMKSKMTQLQNQIDEGMKGKTGASKEIHYKIVNGQLVPQ